MKQLTIKQQMVLEAIEWFINENGYSPTYKELADMLGTTTRPIFEKIMILEDAGYITTTNGKARTIKVLRGIDE